MPAEHELSPPAAAAGAAAAVLRPPPADAAGERGLLEQRDRVFPSFFSSESFPLVLPSFNASLANSSLFSGHGLVSRDDNQRKEAEWNGDDDRLWWCVVV